MSQQNFEKEMICCSFENWYKIFSKKTFPSHIIQLDKEFLEYLEQDNIVIPKSIQTKAKFEKNDSDEELLASDEEEEEIIQKDFPKIQKEIQKALDEFETIFPKLNWSSPRDAVWILPENILKCYTIEDVFLLLKSSDIISNDLSEQVKHDRILVLREYRDIEKSMEFRLFIDKDLKGICQRDCTNYYEELSSQKDQIEKDLVEFWNKEIKDRFPLEKCNIKQLNFRYS